ncbi:hypothetical protein KUCAC02_025546 [Chaenocephalus aceratus]|uniref:Uncharacterized protein n=1 Tax=Chaenocephalus aceratus TaxID=36190 RepID=A0ACB9VU88_CHAAC|nr:hypothetical protein KUCAC02_025546 [Chaenocephalus aceratus]
MPPQGKDALHLLHADGAPRLPHDVADLLLLLDEGPLPRLPVVVLHPPDDILPLSSVATAPHLCPHRRGKCLALPQSALLQGPSDAPPGPPSAETPLLKGDQLAASPHPPQPAVALFGVPPVLRDVLKTPVHLHLTRGGSSPRHTAANPSAECPAPRTTQQQETLSEPPAHEESSLQICFPSTSSSETSRPCICLPLTLPLCQWVSTTSKESQQWFRQPIPKQEFRC